MLCPISQHTSKRLLLLWQIYTVAILVALLAVGISAAFLTSVAVLIPLAVSAVSLTVYQLVYLPVLWDCRTYTRSRGILTLEKGCIFKRTTVIPRSQLRYISVSRHPLERMLGLSTLVFHTTGGSVRLSGLNVDDAIQLKENFSRRFEE